MPMIVLRRVFTWTICWFVDKWWSYIYFPLNNIKVKWMVIEICFDLLFGVYIYVVVVVKIGFYCNQSVSDKMKFEVRDGTCVVIVLYCTSVMFLVCIYI